MHQQLHPLKRLSSTAKIKFSNEPRKSKTEKAKANLEQKRSCNGECVKNEKYRHRNIIIDVPLTLAIAEMVTSHVSKLAL